MHDDDIEAAPVTPVVPDLGPDVEHTVEASTEHVDKDYLAVIDLLADAALKTVDLRPTVHALLYNFLSENRGKVDEVTYKRISNKRDALSKIVSAS